MTCGNINPRLRPRLTVWTQPPKINILRTLINSSPDIPSFEIFDHAHDSSNFWISRSSWNFWIWILDLLTHILNEISSCIGLTINNDPAHVPEHEILTVSTICSDTFRFTIICVRFTCSRLESVLHYLDIQSLCCHVCSIRHRTGYRYLAHSFQIVQTTRFRSLTDRFHPRLGNSLPRIETASLLVCVDDHVRLILVRLVVQLSLAS